MRTFSVFQFGGNGARKILCCEFALGIYFSVLVMFASSALFTEVRQATGSFNSHEIVQLPDDIPPQKIADIIASLREVEGVVESRLLPKEELENLLQPWFSEAMLTDLSPLPFLIEINVSKVDDLDKIQLKKVVGEIVGARLIVFPGTHGVASPHAVWLLIALFFVLFFFIIILVSGVVFLVTRTSLLIYSEMVDVLRLLGASENFVICQLRLSMLKIAIIGGALGAAGAVGTLLLFFVGSSLVHSELYWVPKLQTLHVGLGFVGVAMGIALTWLLVPRLVVREAVFSRKFL